MSEAERLSVPVAEMIPLIRAAVDGGGTAEMTVTGDSMRPLLLDRRSSVRLTAPDGLRAGDIVLFRRDDGHFILHRIIAVRGDRFDIVGDNQRVPDRDIPREAIIARVAAYDRKGKRWRTGDACYRALLPGIRLARRVKNKVKNKFFTC